MKITKRYIVWLFVRVILVYHYPAYSDSQDDLWAMSLADLMEVEVTIATGTKTSLLQTPAVASIITYQDIQAMGALTLGEALEYVPGLHVASSQIRDQRIFSIRGLHSTFNPEVLLLVNGLPVKHLFSGAQPEAFRYPLAGVERIEILRGPGSAVYGADAFSGVINIITKDADNIEGLHIGARYGSFDSKGAWWQYGQDKTPIHLAWTLEYQDTNGDKNRIIDSDAQTIFDQIFGTSASHAPAPIPADYGVINSHLDLSYQHWQFRLWNYHSLDSNNGAGLAQALDPKGESNVNQIVADLIFDKQITQTWQLTTTFRYQYNKTTTKNKIFPENAVLPIGSDGNINLVQTAGLVQFPDGFIGNPGAKNRQWQADLQLNYSGWKQHLIRFGLGYQTQSLSPTETKNFGPTVIDGTEGSVDGQLTDVTGNEDLIFVRKSSRDIYYSFIQDEWQFSTDWQLITGLRFDHYSDFGQTINPRLTLVWQINQDWIGKILYGQAFRAPSFSELFLINNPINLGNPNLQPETIRTTELALSYFPTLDFYSSVNAFYYETDDKILLISDDASNPNAIIRYQNSKGQRGYGFEWETDWQITPKLRLRASYAWQHSETKEANHHRIADAPGQQLSMQFSWNFQANCLLQLQSNHVFSRKRDSQDTRKAIDDYYTLDATLRRKNIAQHLDVAIIAKNITDQDAREPAPTSIPNDYPLNSRSLMAEIQYHF